MWLKEESKIVKAERAVIKIMAIGTLVQIPLILYMLWEYLSLP